MKIKTQTQRKQRAYSKPTCFMIKMEGMDMIAASPNPPAPNPPANLTPPTSEGEEVKNPNPAKEHTGFDAWSTWE